MSHTIDDKIMELADKYTLNHSDEDYLSNKAMLNEFKQEMIEKASREFEDAITQLGLDYHISDEVMESYCTKFKQALEG